MRAEQPLRLYELAAADDAFRFSPHCWKSRMALAHKGLTPEGVPWRFCEKPEIAFSGQGLVPVLVDGETVVADSFRIAEHLEASYPDAPSLFGGETGRAEARFINAWVDGTLMPLAARIALMDIHDSLDARDRAYFRESREKRFGKPLEEVAAEGPQRLTELRAALLPVRLTLRSQPFLCGAAPAYADYCLFGLFMWVRIIARTELLEADDPIRVWRDALLDAFGGLARAAPVRHSPK